MAEPARYALTVMCEDKVGLVARITTAVAEGGGNVEQLYQGVLQGYFVITMLLGYENGASEAEVRGSIEALGGKETLVVSLLPRREDVPPAAEGTPFVLTLSGPDAPGILQKTTTFLADRRINIEDLSSRVSEKRFMIIARLTMPAGADIRAIRLDLGEIHHPHGITVTLMHEDIFRATGRIEMDRRPRTEECPA